MILLTETLNQHSHDVIGTRNFGSPPPMPSDQFPTYVELNWVQAAHKYSICFELVCHCLEFCGLRKETVRLSSVSLRFSSNKISNKLKIKIVSSKQTLLLFDAVKFHENMHAKGGAQSAMDSINLSEELRKLLIE